jgi:hypothetical protein
VCGSPDQLVRYRTLDPKLGASSMARNITGIGVVVDFITETGCEVVARLDSTGLG